MRGVRQGGEIVLLLGEADPSVYCDETFLDAARYASVKRQATISAITGPLLVVPDGWGEHHGLVRAHRKGWIGDLRHRTARFGLFHFRVVETDGTPFFFH